MFSSATMVVAISMVKDDAISEEREVRICREFLLCQCCGRFRGLYIFDRISF